MTATPRYDSIVLLTEAFRTLWQARRFHIALSLLAVLPHALMGLFGVLEPYYEGAISGTQPPGFWRAVLFLIGWAALWNTPMLIFWYRRFLLGPQEVLKLQMNELVGRSVQLIAYSIGLTFVIGVITVVSMTLLGGLFSVISGTVGSMPMAVLLITVMALFFFFGARLALVFASIPLGRSLSLRDGWAKTQGIAGPIIGALAMVAFSTIILANVAHAVATLPLRNGEEAVVFPAAMFVVNLILAPITCAGWALFTIISAKLYRDLIGPPLDAHGLQA